MSQVGYMFLGVGLGAYANGMFHLMTHAFFKALLFMAAGIVIHALANEQDIRKMGGLRQVMPLTYVAFLIGSLALVGIFPFAGFFSKDSILAAALDRGAYGYVLWVAGLGGLSVAWLYDAPRRYAVPHYAFLQRVFEHKFYFDELYDALFYRPTVWAAKGLYRSIEDPLVDESSHSLGQDTRDLGGLVAR